ncbi:MAG: TSUP family transporter [Candidatus Acidiferrales bacterium]
MSKSPLRWSAIFAVACVCGVCSGLVGIGGGVVLIPLLVLLFAFDQHIAQGTSLIALVPPTGLLAFLEYYHAHQVSIKTGLWMIPGVFLGGILGGKLATRLSARRMRFVFAGFLFMLGSWQVLAAWAH